MNIPHSFPTADEAAAASCVFILDLLRGAIEARGSASIAVSGGRTPALLFDYMSRADFPWERLQLFFVDERAVPPDDHASNYRLAYEHFVIPSGFPSANVHRIAGEADPAQAAGSYASAIQETLQVAAGAFPVFDVIQHGMGPDGHTASLFPGEPLIDDRAGIAAAVRAPVEPHGRITLLPGVLLASRASVFLVDGEDKRPALQKVLTGSYDPSQLPTQLVSRSGKVVDWFVSGVAGLEWPEN